MGSVWKRLQRVNKRAAKFQFTASYHELRLETTAKWRPSNLSVVWTRRSRRVASAPLPWEPDMMNPLVGNISWPVPDNHAISVTLFKDPRTHELEDKDWSFVIEDITSHGKKRVLANASINMRKYASIESTQQSFTLNLKPTSRKITAAYLELTISCVFLREGKATDEDMQSVVSLMSVNNNCDVAPLDDLEDIPDCENSGEISDHLFDITQQLEQMTTSLNGCIDLPTPLSVPSLSEDPTPMAEYKYLNFEADNPEMQQKQKKTRRAGSGADTDESLKTPNAIVTNGTGLVPKSSMEALKQFDKKQLPIVTKFLTGGATSGAFTENKNESKIYTSTPITLKVETKTTKSDNEITSVRRGLNFETNVEETTKLENTNQLNQKLLTQPYIENSVNEKVKNAEESSLDDSKNMPPPEVVINNRAESKHRSDLQLLNLKKSYEHDGKSDNQHSSTMVYNQNPNNVLQNPVEKIVLKENTPGQDLLEWCKEITKDCPNVKVTNLTTSWRNGMAFCAIIHHFEPDLIDMSKITAHDVVGNCRTAFDAAESLGIPRVIEPRDMSLLAVPDKLAVMTYLHQLRAHFTGKQLQIERIGPTSDESSYIIGNYKSDNLSSQNLLNLSHLRAQLLHQNSLDDDIFNLNNIDSNSSSRSPTVKKDVKNLILSSSKSILGKVLSPTRDKNAINAQHQSFTSTVGANQTPFKTVTASDDDERQFEAQSLVEHHQKQKQDLSPMLTTPLDTNTANRILTRHKEMSEKAKMMMEKLRISSTDRNEYDDERQQRLREQARKLIFETRSKTTTTAATNGAPNLDTPSTTPTKLKQINFYPERTISPIHNGEFDEYRLIGMNCPTLTRAPLSPAKRNSPPRDIDSINNTQNSSNSNNKTSPSHRLSERYGGVNSPLQSFNAVMERISPKFEKKGDKMSYIESELEALEREQEAIDQKASTLEKKLRAVMGGNPSNNRREPNPFLRLIRNSVGGGDNIRIKLLPDDAELFTSFDNESSSSGSSSSHDSNDENKQHQKQTVHDCQGHDSKMKRRNLHGPRLRSNSCCAVARNSCTEQSLLKKSNHKQNFHDYNYDCSQLHPYSILSSTSSNHSSSDNFKIYSDEKNIAQSCHQNTRRSRSRRCSMESENNEAATAVETLRPYSIARCERKRSKRFKSRCVGESDETEEQLLSQWFTLVNKKNALLRRQMQLNILEQESDLERKYTMLNQELRAAQSVEDWRKTEAQREKERLLLEELVAIVDKRDQLVQHLHNQEIAIEDDHEIARELEQVDISGSKEKCVIS